MKNFNDLVKITLNCADFLDADFQAYLLERRILTRLVGFPNYGYEEHIFVGYRIDIYYMIENYFTCGIPEEDQEVKNRAEII